MGHWQRAYRMVVSSFVVFLVQLLINTAAQTQECSNNTQCMIGFVCVNGICSSADQDCNPECPQGQICQNGACTQATAAPTPAPVPTPPEPVNPPPRPLVTGTQKPAPPGIGGPVPTAAPFRPEVWSPPPTAASRPPVWTPAPGSGLYPSAVPRTLTTPRPSPAAHIENTPGWRYNKNTDHYYYVGIGSYTYAQAVSHCFSANARVVWFNQSSFMAFQNEMLWVNMLATSSGIQTYWIGAKKMFAGGDKRAGWTWSNDEPVQFFNWRNGQPDGCCGGDVTCILVNYRDSSALWDDAGCGRIWRNPQGFICKKPA